MILRSGHSLYLRMTDPLPAEVAAQIDWRIPLFRDGGWRGVLNGQVGRREIVSEILTTIPFTAVIETGTYRGASTGFFCELTDQPVHSVEAVPRFHHYAARRLSEYPNARLTIGDSRTFLTELVNEVESPVFIYLDAHWYENVPTQQEIESFVNWGGEWMAIIDDFEIPSDRGYKYDKYEKVTVGLDLIPKGKNLEVWVSGLDSDYETGAKRGTGYVFTKQTRLGLSDLGLEGLIQIL